MSEAVVACHGLMKTYQGPQAVPVLMGVDLEIFRGERVAIMGRSGSGKSTLLHLLGGLDIATSGQVFIEGRAFSEMGEVERARTRNEKIGFVYQFHHLLAEFTAAENVAMPLFIRRMDRVQALEKAKRALEEVGLGARLDHQPGELSGGERQRCAQWSPSRRVSWPTSRRGISIRTPPRKSSRRCCACRHHTARRS
jgi:lipoprotein-releasing system ATP-binding protein